MQRMRGAPPIADDRACGCGGDSESSGREHQPGLSLFRLAEYRILRGSEHAEG
jgi:hypothetical protein